MPIYVYIINSYHNCRGRDTIIVCNHSVSSSSKVVEHLRIWCLMETLYNTNNL